MAAAASDSVDSYIAAQPAQARRFLEQVRAAIRDAAPEAEESISYKIPAYRLAGAPLIYLAGWTAHASLYPASDALVAALGEDARRLKVAKGTIRLPLDAPAPVALIQAMVRFRITEIAAAKALKTPAKRDGARRRISAAGAGRP